MTVKGTAEAILEDGKAIEGRWIASDETSAVAERGNDKMKEIYEAGFLLLKDLQIDHLSEFQKSFCSKAAHCPTKKI